MALSTTEIAPKILSVLRTDATILSFVENIGLAIRVGPINPKGRFPCIAIEDDPEESESQLPAMHGTITITPWIDIEKLNQTDDPIKDLRDIGNRILILLDIWASGTPLTDTPDIRTVQFRRISGPNVLYHEKIRKFNASIMFEYTMSYHESDVGVDGDATWE